MRRSRRRSSGPGLERARGELSMDPMVDIVFLLLVFFLFTFQLRISEIQWSVETVVSGAGTPADGEPPLKIEMTENSTGAAVIIAGRSVELSALRDYLLREGAGRSVEDRVALLRPVSRSRYEEIVEVAAAVESAEWSLQLATGEAATSDEGL